MWIYLIFKNQNFVVLSNIKNFLNTSMVLNFKMDEMDF